MSGVAVTVTVVSPLWGVLADRRGPKLMVLRAAFGGAITLVAIALVANVQQFFVLRVVQGALTGFAFTFVMLVVALAPPSRMGFSLGIMQFGRHIWNRNVRRRSSAYRKCGHCSNCPQETTRNGVWPRNHLKFWRTCSRANIEGCRRCDLGSLLYVRGSGPAIRPGHSMDSSGTEIHWRCWNRLTHQEREE